MSQTYASYLKLDGLLAQQQPLSEGPEHDELLFIVIHQVFELWFKQILHELDHLRGLLCDGELVAASHTLGRCLEIWKVLVAQIDVLETMTPLEFLSFRERLESASGFQSYQFREVEACLGLCSPKVLKMFPEGSEERQRLERRMNEPNLWSAFLECLRRHGVEMPGGDDSEARQEVLARVYRDEPAIAALAELLVDLDEGIQEWRYRHVKMVERTIGTRPGTGGSAGVEYLRSTLTKTAFPELWAVRSRF